MKYLSLIVLLFTNVAYSQDALEQQTQQAFQRAASVAEPSIVRIQTIGGVDLIGKLLTSTGPTTGVVVREDGYIITSSFNFISKPASIIVTLPNQERFAATVVAQDDSKMLTLLKIDTKGLRPLEPTSKASIEVGQWSLALGRTFDMKFPNISVGIVSAKDRIWGRAVQSDAKISPVNYGGPLVDIHGHGIGILAPLSPDRQGVSAGVEWYDSGIGFAVYLEDIYASLDRMIEGETLKAGLLGVSFEDNGPLSGEAVILKIRPESPADQAGLLVDDVVVGINELPISRTPELKHILGSKYAGDTVVLKIKRGAEVFEKSMILVGELRAYEFAALGILPGRDFEAKGVSIRQVLSETVEGVLKPGDVIVRLNETEVNNRAELAEQLTNIEPEATVELGLLRNAQLDEGKIETVSVKLQAFPHARPDNVEPQTASTPKDPVTAKTGRFNQQVPGEEQTSEEKNFWCYVPENYNPSVSYSLVVWIHPKGDTRESDVLAGWKELCQERNIILVGPRAEDVSGWALNEQEHVRLASTWAIENFTIDPSRVALMAQDDSGVFASELAFKYRELFRGMILIDSPLRVAPPDNDPDTKLLICFVTKEGSTFKEAIEKTVTALQKRFFPTDHIIETEPTQSFHPETVHELGIWIDAMDRL